MGLEDILKKIELLSPEERETLRHELGCMLSKPESQDVTKETAAALNTEQQAAGDERGLPAEDVISDVKDQT